MNRIFFWAVLILVFASPGWLNPGPVRAQAGIELENVGASVQFGEQVTFLATIRTSLPIQDVAIIILDESQGITHTERLDLQPDRRVEYRYDTRRNPLRPFSRVSWNYRFTLPDGTIMHSEVFSVRYVDGRFPWQTLESGSLHINWYSGDAQFGQAAWDALEAGLESVSRILPVDTSLPVEFYLYGNVDDLRGTLSAGSRDWIAGHADPSLGVVMVAIESGPEQEGLMRQRIPHELMHIMMYRAVGEGYRHIPTWLREGAAALAEIDPNPEYERVFREAMTRQDWIPLRNVCSSFPTDAGRAFLAYAESRSFTGYLYEIYGSTGLLALVRAYAGGADCERGPEVAFGVSLSSLERDWHTSVAGKNDLMPALQNMVPYLVLLCLVLIVPMIGILGATRRKGTADGPETYIRK
jgi:hypothetical protein